MERSSRKVYHTTLLLLFIAIMVNHDSLSTIVMIQAAAATVTTTTTSVNVSFTDTLHHKTSLSSKHTNLDSIPVKLEYLNTRLACDDHQSFQGMRKANNDENCSDNNECHNISIHFITTTTANTNLPSWFVERHKNDLTIQLCRETNQTTTASPTTKSNNDYDVFVMRGNKRQGYANRPIGLFDDHENKVNTYHGHVLLSHGGDGKSGKITIDTDSKVFAMGYIDNRYPHQTANITLQAFIRINSSIFYLRPLNVLSVHTHPHTSSSSSGSSSSSFTSILLNELNNNNNNSKNVKNVDQYNHIITDESRSFGSSPMSLLLDTFLPYQQQQHLKNHQHQRQSPHHHRAKRVKRNDADNGGGGGEKSRCPLMIVVDYSIFRLMNYSHAKTILFVDFVFTLSNQIFLNTTFTSTGHVNPNLNLNDVDYDDYDGGGFIYTNYGHSLCKILIYDQEENIHMFTSNVTTTKDGNGEPIIQQKYFEKKLMELPDRREYCFTFLLTNYRIQGAQFTDINGISTVGTIFSDTEIEGHLNVGATSFARCAEPWDLYCVLSVAHELGHAWGSYHDIDTAECMPPNSNGTDDESGGSYLMSFPFLLSPGPNNFKFSPCSIRQIYRKIHELNSISEYQFKEYCKKCGNGKIDEAEECDEGYKSGQIGGDGGGDDRVVKPCCTPQCKLAPGAQCSPANHGCCDAQSCAPTKVTNVPCRAADTRYCKSASYCTGNSSHCPPRVTLTSDEQCENGGHCNQHGYCQWNCPKGTVSCKCPQGLYGENVCYSCCQRLQNFHQNVYDGNQIDTKESFIQSSSSSSPSSQLYECLPHHPLSDGSGCINFTSLGHCRAGVCVIDIVPTHLTPTHTVSPTVFTTGDDEDADDFTSPDDKDIFLAFVLIFIIVISLLYAFRKHFKARLEINPSNIFVAGGKQLSNTIDDNDDPRSPCLQPQEQNYYEEYDPNASYVNISTSNVTYTSSRATPSSRFSTPSPLIAFSSDKKKNGYHHRQSYPVDSPFDLHHHRQHQRQSSIDDVKTSTPLTKKCDDNTDSDTTTHDDEQESYETHL